MHHGNSPINEEVQAMEAKLLAKRVQLMQDEANKLGLGPTGKFPGGKLVEHDEGELQLAVTHRDGKVILNFGTPVAFIGFSPEQAVEIANLLIKHAEAVSRPVAWK